MLLVRARKQSKALYRVKRKARSMVLNTFVPALYENRIVKNFVIDPVFSTYAQRLYKKAAAACPSPQKIIFLEEKESIMPQAMRYFWERMLAEINCEAEFITLRQNNSTIPRYYVHCSKAVPLLAQAKAIVMSDDVALLDALVMRPETKIIQLKHEADMCSAYNEFEVFHQSRIASCDRNASNHFFDTVFGRSWHSLMRPKAEQVLIEADVGNVDISIIIPVFNSRDDLRHALDCVEAQTYSHARIECIVVDDASTDGTAKVAQEFVARSPGMFRLIQRTGYAKGTGHLAYWEFCLCPQIPRRLVSTCWCF